MTLKPPGILIPIVEQIPVCVDQCEKRRLAQIAAKLLQNEPSLPATDAFGPLVSTGLAEAPSFLLQDLSGVALVAIPSDLYLQYRMLLLAREGDLLAIGVRRSPSFETYCRETLDLGKTEVIVAAHGSTLKSLANRCSEDEAVMAKMVSAAQREGSLNVTPYLGTGAVWKLAGLLAQRSGAKIQVSAPPPQLTKRVNDKLWFSRRVVEVLGERAIPPSYCAFGPAALAGRVKAIGQKYRSVGIKIPNSSGALGNIVLSSETLQQINLAKLQGALLSLLHRLGWQDRYPVMVTVWECPVIMSPSVQLWVPESDAGPPIVEGVFSQTVQNPIGEFVGTMPAELPKQRLLQIGEEAARLAYLFQQLGYFGRCSLDGIFVGDDLDTAVLHWVECNGRWGGTSIPMTLANRLVGDWSSQPFVVVERGGFHHPHRNFTEVLDSVRHCLFAPRRTNSGVVLLLPGRFEAGIGMDFMLLEETPEAARAKAEAIVSEFS